MYIYIYIYAHGVCWGVSYPSLLEIISEYIIISLSWIINIPVYTQSPLQDSRLFGPRPWKILAATNEKKVPEQPRPWRKSCEGESCYGDGVY